MNQHTRRWAAGLLALGLTTGIAACGDDDDDDGGSAASGDVATYCDEIFAIETVGEPEIDFENASEEEIVEGVKGFANEQLLPIANRIVASAPDEISDDIDVLFAATEQLAETGDFEAAFDTPEVMAAEDRAHAFDLENCGWEQVDVTASDYAFAGIGASVDAGKTSFEFANEGGELHEMIVIRKNDDTTESFDELLQLPEEEARQKTTFVAGSFAAPGEDDYAVVDLEAGEYIMLCFVPVGTVDEETEVDGPPHFTQGMQHQFTVS